MTLHYFGFATILAILIGSALSYRHAGRPYARGKSEVIPTTPSFRWMYRVIQVSTLLAAVAWGLRWPGAALVEMPAAWMAVGMAISLGGFGLFIWSKRTLGEHYSPCFDALMPTAVVSRGPYARIRHPIYTANMAILAGFVLITGSPWMASVLMVLCTYYYQAARGEERHLIVRHPDYANQMQRTRRFLPRITTSTAHYGIEMTHATLTDRCRLSNGPDHAGR